MTRRSSVLAVVVALQAVATAFFLADVAIDVRTEGIGPHLLVEACVAVALAAGVVVGIGEIRRLLDEARRRDEALAIARGALAELVAARFATWGLTPAERDVALFALKGLEPGEIALLRGAAPGTVRAQLTMVYRKAGVTSRPAFVGLFTEELFAGPLAAADAEQALRPTSS